MAALEAQLAAARKHSGNSSKPPSSDIVKPPKDDPQGQNKKRRRGGQPGHAKHERPEFPPEQIDQTQDYTLTQCPDCGGKLQNAAAAPRLIQQVEISDKPVRIEEHRGLAYWCRHCQRVHYGALPQAVEKAGLAGPKLTALVGFLKGAYDALAKRVAINLNYTSSNATINHCLAEAGIRHVLTSRLVMARMKLELDAELVYLEDLREKVTAVDKVAFK